MSELRKKILLFPLANVLGHLSRTLALAEQLCKKNQDVYVAASDDYAELLALANPAITILSSVEMYADATKTFGQISYNLDGTVDELTLLKASTHLEVAELERRGKRLKKVVDRDAEIIEQVRPDTIIMDHHYAPLLVAGAKGVPLFYISHRVGYPTLCRRVQGEYPYPLNEGTVLLPGIKRFESLGMQQSTIQNNWMMCGMFSWQGWQQIHNVPVANDVFLFFGSTGCTGQLTPWFIDKLKPHYRLSYDNQNNGDQFLDLGNYLKQTSLMICHGGHGTVMEGIRQKKPMIIVPNNLEQLEIGKRVEELKLGVLIARPYHSIDVEMLINAIEKLRTDVEIKESLESFAADLSCADGAEIAADIIINKLNSDVEQKLAAVTIQNINLIK